MSLSVGLEIGTYSIKMVELLHKRRSFRLRRLAQLRIPPAKEKNASENSIAEAIRSLFSRYKVDKRCVISGIGGDSAIVRRIKVPLMKVKELRRAIRWEAEQYIPYPIDQVTLRFHILEEEPSEKEERKMSVILVGVRNEVIEAHLQLLQKVGIHPHIIDINPIALFNIFNLSNSKEKDRVALVDLGHSMTNLILLDKRGPFLIRTISIGGLQLTQAIAQQLNLDYMAAEKIKEEYGLLTLDESEKMKEKSIAAQVDEIIRKSIDDLIEEIVRSFEYYASQTGGSTIKEMVLVGGTSYLKGIDKFLSKELGLPVKRFNPFEGIAYSPKEFSSDYLNKVGSIFAVGLGLALRRREL